MASRLRIEVAGLLGCLLLSGCGPTQKDPGGVEKQLKLAVPLHSSPAQVIEYLEHQKLAHSQYHHDETYGNVIEMEISVKTKRDLVDPSYDVLFLFDNRDQLAKYQVNFLGYVGL
jgi:hypothetical protein